MFPQNYDYQKAVKIFKNLYRLKCQKLQMHKRANYFITFINLILSTFLTLFLEIMR